MTELHIENKHSLHICEIIWNFFKSMFTSNKKFVIKSHCKDSCCCRNCGFVVAYDEKGNEVARQFVFKAGKPHHLEVIWANEKENPEDLCYYTVKVVDKKGNLCPFADNLIRYEGEGFVAAANGDAACLDSFVKPEMHAFAGQCTFIVKKGSKGVFKME